MIRSIAIVTGLILLPLLPLCAQEVPDTVPARIIGGDTLALIDLKAFMAFPPSTPSARKAVARYDKLVYNVRKVYPFAKLAGIKLQEYDSILSGITSDRERKAYMKQAEKELEDQFGDADPRPDLFAGKDPDQTDIPANRKLFV